MNCENRTQAVSCIRGLFSEENLTIQGFSIVNSFSPLHAYIVDNFSLSDSFVDSINYKGIYYCNKANHSVLMYSEEQTSFEVGVIEKIIIKNIPGKDSQILLVYKKTKIQRIPKMGLYKVTTENALSHIDINVLANYYPLYLYAIEDTSDLYFSLRTSPYLK